MRVIVKYAVKEGKYYWGGFDNEGDWWEEDLFLAKMFDSTDELLKNYADFFGSGCNPPEIVRIEVSDFEGKENK